jgi:hypothetical protein
MLTVAPTPTDGSTASEEFETKLIERPMIADVVIFNIWQASSVSK